MIIQKILIRLTMDQNQNPPFGLRIRIVINFLWRSSSSDVRLFSNLLNYFFRQMKFKYLELKQNKTKYIIKIQMEVFISGVNWRNEKSTCLIHHWNYTYSMSKYQLTNQYFRFFLYLHLIFKIEAKKLTVYYKHKKIISEFFFKNVLKM